MLIAKQYGMSAPLSTIEMVLLTGSGNLRRNLLRGGVGEETVDV